MKCLQVLAVVGKRVSFKRWIGTPGRHRVPSTLNLVWRSNWRCEELGSRMQVEAMKLVLLPTIVIVSLNSDLQLSEKSCFSSRAEGSTNLCWLSNSPRERKTSSDLANPGRVVVRELSFSLQMKGVAYCCSYRVTISGQEMHIVWLNV